MSGEDDREEVKPGLGTADRPEEERIKKFTLGEGEQTVEQEPTLLGRIRRWFR